MEVFPRPAGTWPRGLTLVLALALALTFALALGGSALAAQAQPHKYVAREAVAKMEVRAHAADRRARSLRVQARRACRVHKAKSKRCVQTRRRLHRAEAQRAQLHAALRRMIRGPGQHPRLPAKPTPAPEPVPTPVPTPAPLSGFQPGLDSGAEAADYTGAALLGAKLVRIEFSIQTPASVLAPVIERYAAEGIRVLPLAGFERRMPSPAEAANLASWARAYGPGGSFWAGRPDGRLAIQSIEFGNETSYGYQYGDSAGSPSYMERARTYAVRLKEAAEAISASGVGVGLLAQADDWTGDWVNGMFAAVPNLGSYVAGWTIHPYGTGWQGRMRDLLEQTAAHHAPATIPVDVTEWGVASDNGRCLSENYGFNPCMTYDEAASTIRATTTEMSQLLGGRLGVFIVYQVRDQEPSGQSSNREGYFGALQRNLVPKGAETAQIQALLAS